MKTIFGRLVFLFLIAVLTSTISAQWEQWNLVSTFGSTIDLNSSVQLTESNAFIVGENGMLITTNNRGSTWNKIDLGITTNLNSIKFVNEYCGFIVGDKGVILRTGSRWQTWGILSVSERYYNYDVSFVNELNGIVVGYKYLLNDKPPQLYTSILVTSDGGFTWRDKSPVIPGKLNSVIFFDKDRAIVVGNAGLFGFTNDAGENWYFRRLTTSNLNSVRVCKSGTKMIVGDNGALFICIEDDRYRWINYSIDPNYNLTSVCLKALNTFVIAGEKKSYPGGNIVNRSVILETESLTGKWKEVFCKPVGAVNSLNFCNSKSAIAVGHNGMIAVYKKVFTPEPIITNDSPQGIITQNYPNPFNPSTVISFQLPEKSNVELKVFDIIGNEIATLVNEERTEGTHHVTWDASNLPSGIYVYQLKTGSYVQMKKILLLK